MELPRISVSTCFCIEQSQWLSVCVHLLVWLFRTHISTVLIVIIICTCFCRCCLNFFSLARAKKLMRGKHKQSCKLQKITFGWLFHTISFSSCPSELLFCSAPCRSASNEPYILKRGIGEKGILFPFN